MKTILILLVIFFLSCHQSITNNNNQVLDFGAFTIEAPRTWIKVKTLSIDSYVGEIAIGSGDTIGFDLGQWSNSLYEPQPVIWERFHLPFLENMDTTEMIIVENARGIDPDKYKKQSLTWDSIDGREAKIVYPRKPGHGITGVYIDKLWNDNNNFDRFNLYGTDLTPENEQALLKVIKTLKFHKRPKQGL